MRRIGKDISSTDYWQAQSADYAEALDTRYHRHRLNVIGSLIEPVPPGGTVLDFGCGDGVMLLGFEGTRRIGIDPSCELLDRARQSVPGATFVEGGVERLAETETGSVDLLLCLNVAAYFTDEEDARFYSEVSRTLKPGGALVITHSNELFDLFTLNAFTVDFFRRNFGTDPTPLLTHSDQPDRLSYNIRENPLCYRHKLSRYGLREDRQAFSNQHARPPLLEPFDTMSKEYPDTLSVAQEQCWKLMFTCSTFGSRAVKPDAEGVRG